MAASGAFVGALNGWVVGRLNGHLPSQWVPYAGKRAAFVSTIGSIYYASVCSIAQYRGVDEPLNSGLAGLVGGLALGIASRSLWRCAIFPIGTGICMWFCDSTVREMNRAVGLNYREMSEQRQKNGFWLEGWSRRDPYASREKELELRQ